MNSEVIYSGKDLIWFDEKKKDGKPKISPGKFQHAVSVVLTKALAIKYSTKNILLSLLTKVLDSFR